MNIGTVALHSGISAKMIRYYEQIGLIQVKRLGNGYRDYQPEDVETLKFIKHARDLGFDLAKIQTLLQLWHNPERHSRDVKALTRQHIADLDLKIHSLQQIHQTLSNSLAHCHGNDSSECSILSQIEFGNTILTGEPKMKFRIDNMTCGGCARSVTATIQDLDPQAQVNIDVATKLVEVHSTLDAAQIVAALTEDGFPPVDA